MLPTGFRTFHLVSFLYVFFFSFLFLLFRFFSNYFVFVFLRFVFFSFLFVTFLLVFFSFFSFPFLFVFFRFSVYRYPMKAYLFKINTWVKCWKIQFSPNIPILLLCHYWFRHFTFKTKYLSTFTKFSSFAASTRTKYHATATIPESDFKSLTSLISPFVLLLILTTLSFMFNRF